MIAVPYPIISRRPEVQEAYEAMREQGQSHNMAEMLATRSLPGVKTDTRFQSRMKTNGDAVPKKFHDMARAAGIVPDGKQYMRQLADYPGDPRAWVSDASDIKRICKDRGWGCSGAVDVKLPAQDIDTDEKPYTVCDENVNKEVSKLASQDPGCVSTPKKKTELVHKTRERLSGR